MIYIVPFFYFKENVFAVTGEKSEEEKICRTNMQCMWRR